MLKSISFPSVFILLIVTFSVTGKSILSDSSQLKKMSIQYIFPSLPKSGKLIYEHYNFDIYQVGIYSLFVYPLTQRFFKVKNGEEKLDSTSIILEYFIIEKGKPKGIFYKKNKKMIALKDSILSNYMNFANDDSLTISMNRYQLVSKRNLDVESFEEKYIPKFKDQNPFTTADTLCIYFSKKMNDVDYSFSKKLDQLKSLKCIGYKTFSMSKYYPNIPFKVPEMEVNLEMKEVPIDNKEFILSLIEQFKKDKHLLSSQR